MANKSTKVPHKTWAKNVSKSLAYSSIQVMKSFTPSITGTIESFHETSRDLAVSVKQVMPNLKKGQKVLETSENAKTIKKILRSAKDDLRTGNLSLRKDISDIEDDFESYDDYAYNYDKEPDESTADNSEILHRMGTNMNSAIQRGTIANVRGLHNMTETLANVQIRTTEASSRKLSEALLYQTNVLYNAQTETNQILRNIDTNILGMSEFMNENISKTNQAMLKFMENTEAILKDIKEQRLLPSRKSNRRRSSIFDDDDSFISDRGIDFQKLLEVKRKELKNGSGMSELSMMMPMISMISSMGDGIRLPQMILESGILPNMIPKKYRRGLKDLDTNFSSNLESILEMLGSKTFISDGTFKGGIKTTIMKGLQKVLGTKPTYAKTYDAANFSKDEMGWNGYAQKALVDVIPSYLANIEVGIAKLSNLTATDLQKARRFDYRTGRFMSKLEISNEARKGFERTISSSYTDLINYVNEQMSSEMGLTEDNQNVILARLNQMMKKGIRGGGRDSDRLAREIQKEFGQVFNNVQMSNIFNLASQGTRKAKQDMKRFYENMETSDQGHNIFRSLSENSNYDFFDLDKGEDFNFTRRGYSLHDIEKSFRRDFPQYIDEVRFGRREKNVRPDILSVYRKYLDAVTEMERDRLRQHLEDMISDHVQMVNSVQNSKIKKAMNRIITPLMGNEDDRTVIDDINDKLSKILAFNQFNDSRFDSVDYTKYTNNVSQQNQQTLNNTIQARQSSAPQGQWITEHTASENALVRIIPDKLDIIIQLLQQRYNSGNSKNGKINNRKRRRKLKRSDKKNGKNSQQLRQNIRMDLQLFGGSGDSSEDNKLKRELISALDDMDSPDNNDIIESLFDDIEDEQVETDEIVRQLPAIISDINANRSDEENTRLLIRSGIDMISRPRLDEASRENARDERRERQNAKTKKTFDKLFNLETGKLKGITRKVKTVSDYAKYHITGKGYTDIDGAEYEDLAENESVAGRLKLLRNKMFDMTAQYLTGSEDYRSTNAYQSMLHILDPNNQTKLGQLADRIDHPQDFIDAAIIDAAVQTDIRLIEASDSEVEVLFGDVLPANNNRSNQIAKRGTVEETRRKLTSSLSKKWKNLIPKVGTGIAVGAGLGALAGSGSLGLLGNLFFDGGIIPGAIVGGGLTFLNSFQSVNDVIFGKKDDQTGDRTGGIISNKLQKSFKKYLPAVVGGGVLGAVKGVFGGSQAVGGLLGATKGGIILNQLLPGGIVGGALLGMGAGILKQSGLIQRLLFGKKADTNSGEKRSYGLIGKAFTDENKKFAKKAVKGLGIGAITGLTLSNMGILGGALSMGGPIGMGIAGLGMGILSNSEKFSRLLFGDREVDKDGNLLDTRKGGLTGTLIDTFKTSIGQRISDKMDNALEVTKLYALEYLGKPLHKMIDPIVNTVKRLGEDTKEAITTAFDNMAHTVGSHIKGITENVFGKVSNFVGKAARFGIGLMSDQTKSVFKAAALPFKAAGLLTSGMRNRQEEEIRQLGINKGTALLEDKWRQEDEENNGEVTANTRLSRASELINLKKKGWQNVINENYDSLDDNQKRIVEMINHQKRNYKDDIKEAKAKGRKLQEVNDFTRKFVKENNVRSFRNLSEGTKDKYIKSLQDMGLGKYYDLDKLQTGEDVKNFIFNRKDWLDSHKKGNTEAIEGNHRLALEDKSMIRTTEYQDHMEQRTDTVIEILSDIRRASNVNNELISGGSYDSTDPESNFSGDGNVKQDIVDEAHVSENESKNAVVDALEENRKAELAQRHKDTIIAREAEETEAARNGAKTKHDEADEVKSDNEEAKNKISEADTEEKSGIFGTISKWAMRILGIGTLGIFSKELISLGKKYVFPIVKKAGSAIGAAIWSGIKTLTGHFFDNLIDWINGDGKKNQIFEEEKQAEATGQNYFYDEEEEAYVVPASDKYFDENGELQSTEKGSISSKFKKLGRNIIPYLGHADEAVKFGTRAGKLAGKFMKIPASIAGLAGKILHIPGLKHVNGKSISKITGKIGGAVGGALSSIAHAGSMATKTFSSSMKLGNGVAKAALNSGDYLLSTAKNQFASMIAALGKKILSFATNSKLLNICTKHGFESSVLGKLLKSLVDTMTSLASKAGAKVSTYTKMMEEAAAQSAGKVGLSVGTLGLSTTTFAIYDFATGLFEADKLFNVNSDDVTLGMRMISGILKAILGYDIMPVFDIVIEIMSDIAGKDFKCIAATAMYKGLNSLVPGGVGVAAIEALDTAQSVMDIETLVYNQRNGTNLNTASYSDKKDSSWIGKIWNTVTGKEKAYKENEDIAKVLYENGFRNTDKGLVDRNGNVWNVGDAIAKYKESNGKSVVANPTTDYNINQFQTSGMQGYTDASYGYGPAEEVFDNYSTPKATAVTDSAISATRGNKMDQDNEAIVNLDSFIATIPGSDKLKNPSSNDLKSAVFDIYKDRIATNAKQEFEAWVGRKTVKTAASSVAKQVTKKVSNVKWSNLTRDLVTELGDDASIRSRVIRFVVKICDKVKGIINNQTLEKITSILPIDITTIKKYANEILDIIKNTIGRSTTEQAKVIKSIIDRGIFKIGTGVVLDGVYKVYDTIQGFSTANILFDVEENETTLGMQVISSLINVLLGSKYGKWLDIIIDALSVVAGENYKKYLANTIYSLWCKAFSDEDAMEKLTRKQEEMKVETIVYNTLYGESLTTHDYAQLKDVTILNTLSNFFNGKSSKLKKCNAIASNLVKKGYVSHPKDQTKLINPNNTVVDPKDIINNKELVDDSVLGYGLAQNDPRWANFKLGKFANGKTSTMATGGCGPTALAQVAGVNPMTVAKMAKSNGYISQGGANAGLMTSGANKLGLRASNAKSSYIKDLQRGKPVVISGVGNRGNSPFTKAGHIITATGLTKRGDVVVSDPMTGRRAAYSKKTIDAGMTGAWSYSRKRRLGYGEALEDQTMGASNKKDYNINDVSYGRHVEVNSDNSQYTFYNEDGSINRVYYKSLKDGYYYQGVNGQSSEGLPSFPGQKITSESAMRSEIITFCGRYVVGGKNLLNNTNDAQNFRNGEADTIDGIVTREKTAIYDPQRIEQDTKSYASKYRLENGLWWYPQKNAEWSDLRYNGGSIGGYGSDIVSLAMTLSNLTGKAITPAYVLENMLPRMRHNTTGTELNWNKLFSNTYGVQYLPEIAGGYKDRKNDESSQYAIPEGIEKLTVNQLLSKYSESGIQKAYKFNSRNITKSNYSEVVKSPALYMMQGHRYETSPFSMTDVLSKDSRSYLPEFEEVTGKDKNSGSIVLLNSGVTDINGVNKGMILAPSALTKDKGYRATNFGFLQSGLGEKRNIDPLTAPTWAIERLDGGFPLASMEQDLKKDAAYSSEALGSHEISVANSENQEKKSENVFDQLLDIFKKVFTIGMTKVSDALAGKEYERIIDNSGNYLTYTDSDGVLRYKHNGESADGTNSSVTGSPSAIEISANNIPTTTSSDMSAYENMSDLKVGDNMKVSKYVEAYAKDKDLYHKIAAYSLAASKQNEGEFYSINRDDNGEFSVGLKQWRAGRAETALRKMAEIVDEPIKSTLLKYANKAGKGPLTSSEASELREALKAGGDRLEKFQYEYGTEDTYASELPTIFKMYESGELQNARSMIPIGAIANTGAGHVINWRKKWKDSPRNHHYERGNLNEIDDVRESLLSTDSWWGTRKDWHPYIKNASAFAKALPQSVGFGEGMDSALEEPMTRPVGFGPSDVEGGGNVSASTIINAALKEQGVTEQPANSNKVKYNTEFYGSEVSGSAYPWCVVFPWWVFKHAGASSLFGGGQKFASCTAYMNWSKANGRWHDAKKGKPYPGDIAIMGFGGSEPKHMGLVIGNLSNGKVQTIEGNTSSKGSQDNGGAVLVKERAMSDFIGFDRPPYNGMGVVDKNAIGNSNYVNPTNEMSYDNVSSNFYTNGGTESINNSNGVFGEFANVLSNISSIAMTRMSNAIIGKASDNVAVGYGSGGDMTSLQDKLNIAVQADGVEKKLDVLIDVMKDFVSNFDKSPRGATTAYSAKGYGEGGNTTNVTINKTIQNSNFRQSGNGVMRQQQSIANLRKIHNQISR